MSSKNNCVAKRTRLQAQLHLQRVYESVRNESRKRKREPEVYEVIDLVDDDDETSTQHETDDDLQTSSQSTEDDEDEPLISSSESESDDSGYSLENKRLHKPTPKGKEKVWSGSAARKEKNPSIHKLNKKRTDKKPLDESTATSVHRKENAKDKVKDSYIKVEESDAEDSVSSLDDSDSNEGFFIVEEQEEADDDVQTSCKLHHGSENSTKAGPSKSIKDDEDAVFSSSENEKDDFEFHFSPSNMRPKHPTTKKQEEAGVNLHIPCTNGNESQKNAKSSSLQSTEGDEDEPFSSSESENDDSDDSDFSINKEKVWSRSTAREEKNPSVHKLNIKRTDKKPLDESTDTNVHEKQNEKDKVKDSYMKEEESDGADSVYSMDDSDSDNGFVILEEADVDIHILCKNDNERQKNTKASSLQSTIIGKGLSFSSSESDESDESEDSNFSLENKRPHQPTTENQTFMRRDKEKVCSESVVQKEKGHLEKKSEMGKTDQKPMDESSETNVHEKQNAKDKYKEPVKGRGRDDAGCVDDILDSIISNEDDHGKKEDGRIALKFRFDDSEDESSSQKTVESNGEHLFKEMDYALTCDEIGSSRVPKVEHGENGDYYDNDDICENGKHGDVYYEEQNGLRCGLCGAVLVESKYVISKFATYARNTSKRSYLYDKQRYSSQESPYFVDSDSKSYDMCSHTKGTVWELISTSIREHMYPHQQEGFEFLWKNLVGTVELSRIETLDPSGGGGCIISHAPGTGKTFLTIVFLESFLKKFPKCCPVIVAPASMLLTWEAEFKKWRVGFSFINLQNSEPLSKEEIIGSSRNNKDFRRAMKIHSWIKGGSVLGVSYHLYEKLTRSSDKKNISREKIRLLDMPGLVVLDEGHTPRNQHSKIWNTLLKLQTKNRVILSGTPFQNNFRELFNTLRIVRPEIADSIENEKCFADMIQRKSRKKGRVRSSSEDIEKLKAIISPFVHVHKGHILQSKLPGLKQSIILLNPPAFQKGLIENLGISGGTFEYEHKVALVSVHPSLILHCSLTEKERISINKQELEDVRLKPEVGVKTRFVMELIRLSLSLTEKVLIFSQYIQPLELLQEQLAHAFGWDAEKEITLIKGVIHQTSRQKIINAFNDPKSGLNVLLASTKCCSEGIHLSGASRVVLLDVVWNPSVERQAISRAYRLGQKKVVYTYHLMAAGTTEEDKYDRQVEKGRLAEMVFSSAGQEPKTNVNVDDKILQEMVDNQELKGVFKKIRYPENQSRI